MEHSAGTGYTPCVGVSKAQTVLQILYYELLEFIESVGMPIISFIAWLRSGPFDLHAI